MTGRTVPLLEIGVALAAAASAVLLVGMLASPLVPTPTPSPLPTAVPVTPRPSDAAVPLPMGLYVAREPLSFGELPCVAIELVPESYVAPGEQGVAEVLTWRHGMTGCDTRSTEITTIQAAIEPTLAENGPSAGEVFAYTLRFPQSLEGGPEITVEIAILLPDRPNAPVLQALEVSSLGGGGGMVLDLVDAVTPSFVPIPTQAP